MIFVILFLSFFIMIKQIMIKENNMIDFFSIIVILYYLKKFYEWVYYLSLGFYPQINLYFRNIFNPKLQNKVFCQNNAI